MRHAWIWRLALLAAFVALLEWLCAAGVITSLTMPPPHRMIMDLWRMLRSGALDGAIIRTLSNALVAFLGAMLVGVTAATLLHRLRFLRETLDPLFATYYAIPVFAFYPLLIILFGLGDLPEIFIGFMLAVVSVVVTTLNGLDRVPRVLLKTARVSQLGAVETVLRITLPFISPYLLTAAKLALAYALIGVIGAEFIMSSSGMGYEISFAYENFDNATMYPLILLVVLVSVLVNALLARWERALLVRRGLA
jgi:NitT/TauT family transport system permease protein